MGSQYVQQFKKGALDMILLSLLSEKESYGYEIITELNERTSDVLGFAREGTVYPILYRLQQAGLLQTRTAPAEANGGSRKYYSLTPKGSQTLREMTDFWRRYAQCVNDFIGNNNQEDAS